MRLILEAACGCNTGRVRRNNEDNFCFDGKCLEMEHNGLKEPAVLEEPLKYGTCLAVFDGMGGENFGEVASYTAARAMQQAGRKLADYFVPAKNYLTKLTTQLNDAVVHAKHELRTNSMGSTMVALYFSSRSVHVCNVGDSRAYRLRGGEFLQISREHVERRPGREDKKAPLTQYLGIDPEDMLIDPHIAKGELNKGDMYLLCSDGLTDMLTNFEISDIMLRSEDAAGCVQNLIRSALEHGGRDNITVIVCRMV